MITIKKHTPAKGDYFQPSTSIRKLFKGKFEAWYLYEEFISNTEVFLSKKTKKDLMKSTGLSERKWDKAITDLQELGFLLIETSYATETFGKIYHFSSTPNEDRIPVQSKDSKFTPEEWKEIHKERAVKVEESKQVIIEPYVFPINGFNEEIELPF